MSSLIKLEQVSKSYESNNEIHTALKDINFVLNKGEMTAIVGKSGSGKSTLMNIIGLLDTINEGKYFFRDRLVSSLDDDALSKIRNESIGFIFQSFYLLQRSTVIDNVILPLLYRGVSNHQARANAEMILNKIGLGGYGSRYPNQLSGGQQQRVAIARALIGHPAILLADEPTGALDSQTSDDIMQLLLQLNQEEGTTILIITHDQHISHQCKRIIHIQDGYLSE